MEKLIVTIIMIICIIAGIGGITGIIAVFYLMWKNKDIPTKGIGPG